MKLKTVLFDNTPKQFVEELKRIRPHVMRQVLIPHLPHLHISPDLGPAEFYVQCSDTVFKDEYAATTDWMCDVRLTGVSGSTTNFHSSIWSFWEARTALTELFAEKVRLHIPVGHRVQLFVVIIVDEPVPIGASGTLSHFVLSTPKWVLGECPTN